MFGKNMPAPAAGWAESDAIAATKRQLELAGAECPFTPADTVELPVSEIPGTAINRLLAATAECRPVSVTVRFGASGDKKQQLAMLCLRLQELTRGGHATGLVVAAGDVQPQLAWSIRCEYLGEGPLSILVNSETPAQAWHQLWRLRDQPLVRAVLPSRVRSPCSLLTPELAGAVTHDLGLRVPVYSAWVPMRLALDRFADASGALNEDALNRALVCCVESGDKLHDLVPWQCGATRHDAWFNRRLAVELGGLARLAKLRNVDPDSLADVSRLDDDLRRVRNTLCETSLRLAKRRGVLPSIEQTDPVRRLPAGAARDDWHMRWRRAVSGMSYRHRTLVAMSPWSAVSPGEKADFRYANLLPLLAETDVVAFRRTASITHWNVNQFRDFYARTWAVLRRKNAASVFAERL